MLGLRNSRTQLYNNKNKLQHIFVVFCMSVCTTYFMVAPLMGIKVLVFIVARYFVTFVGIF